MTPHQQEQLEILRRIAERGLKLAQSANSNFTDLFQHILDELEKNIMKNVLLTGGCGFVGANLVDWACNWTDSDWSFVLLDRLDHSGTLERVAGSKGRVRFVYHDLKAPLNDTVLNAVGRVDYVLHLAAMSHVDRSIQEPLNAVMENVVGTCNILDAARKIKPEKVLYFSTDEVFGPARSGEAFKEWDRYNSGNPYAATKAGGEELALAYHNTYKLPVIITHTMNVFGPMQNAEKYIPGSIKKIINGETIQIHSDHTRTKPGSRFYIHAYDVAAAILYLMVHGQVGDKYNIVGEKEIDNRTLVQLLASSLASNGVISSPSDLSYKLVDFHSSRPGHDLRYALDGSKLLSMGWKHAVGFEQGLEGTVKWYLNNRQWLL